MRNDKDLFLLKIEIYVIKILRHHQYMIQEKKFLQFMMKKSRRPRFNHQRKLSQKNVAVHIIYTGYCFLSLLVSLSELDPPEHLFRIRLICTLLDTCGHYFDRGSTKKKMDCFLVFFQVSINALEYAALYLKYHLL